MKKNDRIKMGVLMPSIYIGGGELATLFAVQQTDLNRISWEIVVVTEDWKDDNLLASFSNHTRVFYKNRCYYKGDSWDMTLEQAMQILKNCDGVIAWELDEKRSKLFNACLGKKIYWIFRHDEKHKLYTKPNHILLTCEEACIKNFGDVGEREVFIIPSSIDLNHCVSAISRKEIRSRWNINDEVVVGYLGRMDKNKNIPAIARAVYGQENYVAMCFGERNWQSADVLKEIEQLCGPNFRWNDPIFNVGDALKGFDVLMLPSYSEVFSLTLLEAWANRIPVVCTNVGAVPNLQKKFGKICVIIEQQDSGEVIRERIREAMADCAMVERAFNMVMEFFTPTIVSKKWNEFIINIVRSESDDT